MEWPTSLFLTVLTVGVILFLSEYLRMLHDRNIKELELKYSARRVKRDDEDGERDDTDERQE